MIRKLSALFFVFLLIFNVNCARKPPDKQTTSNVKSQENTGNSQAIESWTRGKVNTVNLSDEEKKAIEIETAVVSFKSINSQLQVMGRVLAHQLRKAIVSYAFPARISEIHVRTGDWVKAGQKLVTLQSEEVGKAKSEYYKAIAEYELARSNYERAKRLFDHGVGAQKNLLISEVELKNSQVNLNAAEKRLHVLGFTEEEVKAITEKHQINPTITLYAPVGGKVIRNDGVLGSMIDQSTEILTIMDPALLWVDAEIYEKDIAKIKIGQKAAVSVPAYPDETFSGKIFYISDVLNEETRTITVRTEVENKSYKLKPGMFANIKIYLNNLSQALAVPEEAVLDDKGNKIVFVMKDGSFYPQLVEPGIKENGYVAIIKGLQAGDQVVTRGNYQLKSKLYDEILKRAGVH